MPHPSLHTNPPNPAISLAPHHILTLLAPPIAPNTAIPHNHCKRKIIPRSAPSHLPPLSKVRCCRPKKFGRLPEGLPLHQPFQNRTIPCFAPSHLPPLSKGGGLTARHKLLLCCFLFVTHPPFFIYQTFLPSRRRDCLTTIPRLHQPSQSRNIPRSAPRPCLPCQRECCRPKKFGRLPEGLPLHQPFQNRTIPCFAPSHLPPLSKVRCCRPKKFGRLPEGLLPIRTNSPNPALSLAPHHVLASPRKRGGGTAVEVFRLAVQYSDSPAFTILKLFRAVTVGIAPHPHQPSQNRTIPCPAPCPCLPCQR